MRKSNVFLIVILFVIVAVGGYFGYKNIAVSEDQAVKDLQSGEAYKTEPADEMINGYSKSKIARAINAYRSLANRAHFDFSENEIYLEEMSKKHWEKVVNYAGCESVKDLKEIFGYDKGYIASFLDGNVNYGFYLFEDIEANKLSVYSRAFKRTL